MTTIIFGILFLLGVGLIIARPLEKATGISMYWEIGAGALLVVMFAIHLSSTYVQPAMMEEEIAKRPCGEDSPQGLCYNLTKSLCETAWASAEARCKAEVSGILKNRPSALVGPIMNRCRAQKMDLELRYNRANTDTGYCKSYFEFIERR
ncbi:hypothetical protein [Bdellovibrio sp. HCB337]|uniref:hypothetical protein n=1 Tax=Bdellovibrio sp. HCB337 TaxID=3394358 RepID=UPI0039A555FB